MDNARLSKCSCCNPAFLEMRSIRPARIEAAFLCSVHLTINFVSGMLKMQIPPLLCD